MIFTWTCLGIGILIVCLALADLICKYEPCKHEWEYMNVVYYDGKKGGDKFRCVHCCKRKEV